MEVLLPEFDRPPVIEVVLAVQFERLEVLSSPQLGYVWQEFRHEFPKTEEHSPLDPVFEQFGRRVGGQAPVKFEMLSSFPSPRIWFLNDRGSELVQIQRDRFIRNWRKRDDDDSYPRYHSLRQQFSRDFERFCAIIATEGWGPIEPNQCEVTYVNIIVAGDGWREPGELGQVLTLFRPEYSDSGLGLPEEAMVNVRYILEEGGSPIGRLHVAVAPVVREIDGASALRLSLTARGLPRGDGIKGVLDFLDRGHEEIVRGFTSITTPAMHAIWGRKS